MKSKAIRLREGFKKEKIKLMISRVGENAEKNQTRGEKKINSKSKICVQKKRSFKILKLRVIRIQKGNNISFSTQ